MWCWFGSGEGSATDVALDFLARKSSLVRRYINGMFLFLFAGATDYKQHTATQVRPRNVLWCMHLNNANKVPCRAVPI